MHRLAGQHPRQLNRVSSLTILRRISYYPTLSLSSLAPPPHEGLRATIRCRTKRIFDSITHALRRCHNIRLQRMRCGASLVSAVGDFVFLSFFGQIHHQSQFAGFNRFMLYRSLSLATAVYALVHECERLQQSIAATAHLALTLPLELAHLYQ